MTIGLSRIGNNLKTARKKRFPQDRQVDFAIRVEIGLSTYKKMEKGDLTVGMGQYVKAAEVLGLKEQFSTLFTIEADWFDD